MLRPTPQLIPQWSYAYPKGIYTAITYLDDILSDAQVIEDILGQEASEIIQSEMATSKKLSKAQILRFFQERLASDNVIELGTRFKANTLQILNSLQDRLKSFSE